MDWAAVTDMNGCTVPGHESGVCSFIVQSEQVQGVDKAKLASGSLVSAL